MRWILPLGLLLLGACSDAHLYGQGQLTPEADRLGFTGRVCTDDARDVQDLPLHLFDELTRDGTAGSRKRHADPNALVLIEVDFVDEPELVDVHRDLRVVDRTENLDDRLLDFIAGLHRAYSVVIVSSSLRRAAQKVCQGKLAHLTRIG